MPKSLDANYADDAHYIRRGALYAAMPSTISVIIPCMDEEEHIGGLIDHLKANDSRRLVVEIVVVDGGSTDRTAVIAKEHGAIVIHCSRKGRAVQMNLGAKTARGEVLYFLHADCLPPAQYAESIAAAISSGAKSGCYRLSFDYNHWFLRANCWFTRFNVNAVRFGDQSLFVSKEIFERVGGFNDAMLLMEDHDIVARLKQNGQFRVLQASIITSARKYLDNGIFKLQLIFALIYTLYKMGYSQCRLIKIYKSLIRQDML